MEAGDNPSPPGKRGRPSKVKAKVLQHENETTPKRGRGRPPKPKAAPSKARDSSVKAVEKDVKADVDAASKKRGRPPRTTSAPLAGQTRKRGRGTNDDESAAKTSKPEAPPPKKRGRPRTTHNTATITGNDASEAESVPILDDGVEQNVEDSAKTKAAKSSSPVGQLYRHGQNFWLMKAEQEDRFEKTASGKEFNTKFTIDDLKAVGVEPWDGVRNVVARNNMRTMKQSEFGFFYASQGKKGRQPGITGILQIAKEAEPDWTVEDPDHYGYIPEQRSRLQDGEPKWSLVHVKFCAKLAKPITLEELKKHSKESGGLSDMQLFRAARLSVSKVSKEEWDYIFENMIEEGDIIAEE